MAKLTKNDWLDHGLEALEKQGFTTLKADVLAKSLGVSRGSFYHHFKDLADFHQALLDRWLEVSSLDVASQLESEQLDPNDKLVKLLELASSGSAGLEQAIRAWAFSDPKVAATVTQVDQTRASYLTHILTEVGLSPAVAHRRSTLIYLSNVGYQFLSSTLKPAERKGALDDLVTYATAP